MTVAMEVPAGKAKELVLTLLAVTEQMRSEHGCIGCDFLKDVRDENRYRLIGKWNRQEGLDDYLRSERFSVLLGAMSLLQKQPEIRLDVVSYTKGIEEIYKTRDEQKRNNLSK